MQRVREEEKQNRDKKKRRDRRTYVPWSHERIWWCCCWTLVLLLDAVMLAVINASKNARSAGAMLEVFCCSPLPMTACIRPNGLPQAGANHATNAARPPSRDTIQPTCMALAWPALHDPSAKGELATCGVCAIIWRSKTTLLTSVKKSKGFFVFIGAGIVVKLMKLTFMACVSHDLASSNLASSSSRYT